MEKDESTYARRARELAQLVIHALTEAGWIDPNEPDMQKAVERRMRQLEDAGKSLARLGWVVPMSLTPKEVLAILAAETPAAIDAAFVALHEAEDRDHFRQSIGDMISRESLKPWHALIGQADAAYRRGHYAITVPALITVIEGVLMTGQGNNIKVLAFIDAHVRDIAAKTPESITLLIWRIAREFINELFRKSDFDGPKPTGLNRHWIMRGRDAATWTQADSLRLFQAVDTISDLVAGSKVGE